MEENIKTLKTKKIVRQVPIVAIRGSVVFPHTDDILTFGRPKSVYAVNSAFQEDRVIAIFSQKDPKTTDPGTEDLYKIGTIATITQMMSTEGEVNALVRGQARVKLDEIVAHEPFLIGKVNEIEETDRSGDEVVALSKQLVELFRKAVNFGKQAEIMTVMKVVSGQADPSEIADQVASTLDIKPSEKQKLLEETSLLKRQKKVVELITHEVNVLDIERNITAKTQKKFEDQMRKAMLREKKKTIEAELGEEESELDSEELGSYRKKIRDAKMPKDVRIRAKKELKRLMQMSPHNPEGGSIRN
jgi:ATP-dependent Lon protease